MTSSDNNNIGDKLHWCSKCKRKVNTSQFCNLCKKCLEKELSGNNIGGDSNVNWASTVCRGAHCKCMDKDCTNYHYGDHPCPAGPVESIKATSFSASDPLPLDHQKIQEVYGVESTKPDELPDKLHHALLAADELHGSSLYEQVKAWSDSRIVEELKFLLTKSWEAHLDNGNTCEVIDAQWLRTELEKSHESTTLEQSERSSQLESD